MKEYAVAHVTNIMVPTSERHFLEALTRWNYFPNQKASAAELPPTISTRNFTPEVAKKLKNSVGISAERRALGFDMAEYRATRYNNVSRVLGLIHPLAFAQIFDVMESCQADLLLAMKDQSSAIHIDEHQDGRMLIMNYEDQDSKALSEVDRTFSKKFRAHTDVANCFGSIYTHSLEWAAQGFEVAKSKLGVRQGETHWSTKLDQALQRSKRKETSGLPIGPASSSIAVEIILAAVDRELESRFTFTRYIDDYTAECNSYDEAQEFVRLLGKELSKYRLTLNLAKTYIVELPEPLQERWVAALMSALPPLLRDDDKVSLLSTSEAFQFLDYAVRLNNETPDGSVIKFAVATIVGRVKDKVAADVLGYVLGLSWHYPILLPYLEKIDPPSNYYNKEELAKKLNSIIDINVLHRRSDGICWALYYLERLNLSPDSDTIGEIIKTNDCVALAMLCNFDAAIDLLIKYALGLADNHIYIKDQHWLFLYQLYRKGKIENPYIEETTFEVLKGHDVDFFCSQDKATRAEDYCFLLSNPFVAPQGLPEFDQWMRGAEYVAPEER